MTPSTRTAKTSNLLLGFSPWMLAVAVTLLLLVLVLFSVSNYQREKELMGEILVQKGLTLMRFINSSARDSMRDSLRLPDPTLRWEDHLRIAMEQAIEQPGVDSVLLIDQNGVILAGAGSQSAQDHVDKETLTFARSLKSAGNSPFISKIIQERENNQVTEKFQIVAWHMPANMSRQFQDLFNRGPGRGQMMRRFSTHPQFAEMYEEMKRLTDKELMYVVHLDFERVSSSLKRQFVQIVILSIVICLVGVAAALSYLTLRGLKGSQKSLGEMRAFTDILVSALPIGLIATDSQGVIQVCNDAAGEVLGTDTGRIRGKLPEVCLPEGLARMFSGTDQVSQENRQKEIFLEQDSKKKTLQLASMVVLDHQGRVAGEVLLIRDLTEVKSLEKELRRSERLAALGKMAAGVAHELRNPLSSIKGLAVLLRSQLPASNGGSDTADVLVKEVERLNRSIGELLDYARPEQLSLEATSIEDIINKTVSLVRADAESYNISIILSLAKDLPPVKVDRDKLNQVLLNLLLNAVQAMVDGGVLEIKTEREGGMLIMSVVDNGVGIAPENLQRIFDPYFTTKSNGTGLGLAISNKIVEEHGGSMKVFSLPGEYTEIKVVLPI